MTEDQNQLADVVRVMTKIHEELQALNQTMAKIAQQPKSAPAPEQSGTRPRTYAPGRSRAEALTGRSREDAPRYSKGGTGAGRADKGSFKGGSGDSRPGAFKSNSRSSSFKSDSRPGSKKPR